MTKRHIYTYDCTLRDGEQSEGISLSLADKLAIAKELDTFGIDYIEGGYPASNPKDQEFFARIHKENLMHSKMIAFGMTCKKEVSAHEDMQLNQLLNTPCYGVALVGKVWDMHVIKTLEATLEENLRMIGDAISYAKSFDKWVVFDAEHFFDGYKSNEKYALKCIDRAIESGADSIDLCDTNGGCLPSEISEITAVICKKFPSASFGIHCHNDSGCAVANTISAVQSGISQIQGTICGVGERVGNCDLLVSIANLELKLGLDCVGHEKLSDLHSLAQYISLILNTRISSHYPYIGNSAFAHKGGLHASAISKFQSAYEHINPSLVGNNPRVLVSELSGRASLITKAKSLGFNLENSPEILENALNKIKELEHSGYSFESADGSLSVFLMEVSGIFQPHFSMESYRVIVDDYSYNSSKITAALSEATIKLHVNNKRFVATGEGRGPVGALDTALRKALDSSYPELSEIELVDFKVRLLDESVGTAAVTRVAITTRDKFGSWGTIGVSENIIEAAWHALVDSIEYGLYRFENSLK